MTFLANNLKIQCITNLEKCAILNSSGGDSFVNYSKQYRFQILIYSNIIK